MGYFAWMAVWTRCSTTTLRFLYHRGGEWPHRCGVHEHSRGRDMAPRFWTSLHTKCQSYLDELDAWDGEDNTHCLSRTHESQAICVANGLRLFCFIFPFFGTKYMHFNCVPPRSTHVVLKGASTPIPHRLGQASTTSTDRSSNQSTQSKLY